MADPVQSVLDFTQRFERNHNSNNEQKLNSAESKDQFLKKLYSLYSKLKRTVHKTKLHDDSRPQFIQVRSKIILCHKNMSMIINNQVACFSHFQTFLSQSNLLLQNCPRFPYYYVCPTLMPNFRTTN